MGRFIVEFTQKQTIDTIGQSALISYAKWHKWHYVFYSAVCFPFIALGIFCLFQGEWLTGVACIASLGGMYGCFIWTEETGREVKRRIAAEKKQMPLESTEVSREEMTRFTFEGDKCLVFVNGMESGVLDVKKINFV